MFPILRSDYASKLSYRGSRSGTAESLLPPSASFESDLATAWVSTASPHLCCPHRSRPGAPELANHILDTELLRRPDPIIPGPFPVSTAIFDLSTAGLSHYHRCAPRSRAPPCRRRARTPSVTPPLLPSSPPSSIPSSSSFFFIFGGFWNLCVRERSVRGGGLTECECLRVCGPVDPVQEKREEKEKEKKGREK